MVSSSSLLLRKKTEAKPRNGKRKSFIFLERDPLLHHFCGVTEIQRVTREYAGRSQA